MPLGEKRIKTGRPTSSTKEELLLWLEHQVRSAEMSCMRMDDPPRRAGETYAQAMQNAHRTQLMTVCAALGAADALVRSGVLSPIGFDAILVRLGAKVND